jgi:type 1 glutamine amidotransferase
MEGLPKTFRVTDELYHFKPDPEGAKITVLARAKSPATGEVFPQVWLVEHPRSRIACITLGHDGRAHELSEYQRLIRNLFQWASERR